MNTYRKIFSPLEHVLICEHKIGGIVASTQPVLHNHDGYEILVYLGGRTNFYTEQAGKALVHGDVLCIPPYAFHYAEPIDSEAYDRIVLSISDTLLAELSSAKYDLSSCFSLAPRNQINLLPLDERSFHRLTDYCNQLEDILKTPCYGAELLVNALLTQILVLLNSPAHQTMPQTFSSILSLPVKHTFSYIEEHLTESFTIMDLAQALHHNADYLNRCFKKSTGLTLQSYIIAKRIALAQEILSKGNPPIDACYSSGFNNYSNFSRTFTQLVGMSPKKYQSLKINGRK